MLVTHRLSQQASGMPKITSARLSIVYCSYYPCCPPVVFFIQTAAVILWPVPDSISWVGILNFVSQELLLIRCLHC